MELKSDRIKQKYYQIRDCNSIECFKFKPLGGKPGFGILFLEIRTVHFQFQMELKHKIWKLKSDRNKQKCYQIRNWNPIE
jgi:hypothetical protein